MLLLICFVFACFISCAWYYFCDNILNIFPMILSALSTVCLFNYLIIIPIHRAEVRSYYYGYLEMQESIKNMEQMEGTEKTAIYLKVIEMNNTIQKNKYYAESD